MHKTCFILTLEELATEPHFKERSLLVHKHTLQLCKDTGVTNPVPLPENSHAVLPILM